MKFAAIAPGQISRSSIERRKYCFYGLQPDKSSDTPTCREKLISYYFLRFKHRQDAIVTRRTAGEKCLYFFSAESRGVAEKSFRSRRHESASLFSLLPSSLSFLSVLHPSPPAPRRAGGNTAVGFTRHEIGRPNKANCRTFLAG